MRARRKVLSGFFCLLAGAFAIYVASIVAWATRVTVTVVNVGSRSLDNVSVEVRGRSYTLGQVGAGGQAAAIVRPTGESSIWVAFDRPDGSHVKSQIDCYLEPNGYKGTVRVEVDDRRIRRTDIGIMLR